jgi:hypothetical protein
MPPPAPLNAKRVMAIWKCMTPEERWDAEELRRADEFRRHCEHEGIGKTRVNLVAYVMSFARVGSIWGIGETAAESAARQRADEAAEARDPVARVRAGIERARARAEEADEAVEIACTPRGRKTPADCSLSARQAGRRAQRPKAEI